MFEAVGVTVSRLIRTRFGDIVLPRTLRRGRWEELDASLVTALMVQLGLLRDDDESGGRRRSKQPQSHDSALPPGFGTLDRNGMNGARIGRRGKLQGGRQGSPGQVAACPSDPFGTGLMIAGGYANGHPLAAEGSRKGKSGASRGGKGGGKQGGKGRGQAGGLRAAAAGASAAPAAVNANAAPAARKEASKSGGAGKAGGNARGPARPAKQGGRAAKAEGPRGGKPAAKSRSPRGSSARGDDWQPRGASAHESRLGILDGRGRGGR